MFRYFYHRFGVLALALAALACLLPAQAARTDEPETAIVALLFSGWETPPECLEDPLGIVFGVGSVSNSTTKTLSSTFGEPFGNENLYLTRAVYVSEGGIRDFVVHGFSSAPLPSHGFMGLGPNSDAVILYCGRVTENSHILEPNEFGEYLLVIVVGTVR